MLRVGYVFSILYCKLLVSPSFFQQEERSKVDELRGTPMAVGSLEEIIDDNHAIVSTSVGSEYYVNMLSFVDKDLIEPGCTVLLNNKVVAEFRVLCRICQIVLSRN